MDLRLSGKKVIVTGASKGIGAGVAEWFAREGCEVFLVSRTEADLRATAARLTHAGRPPSILPIDISQAGAVERIFEWCPDADILINNAGAIPPGDLLQIDKETWRKAWDMKIYGYIDLSRLYFGAMSNRRAGVIVNIIGAAGEIADSNYIVGATGNAALIAFTRALGATSLDNGVRVNGINPGPVETDRLVMLLKNRALQKFNDESRWEEFCAHFPLGRSASVDEIAAATVFLASPLSNYTSGATLTIDGGLSKRVLS